MEANKGLLNPIRMFFHFLPFTNTTHTPMQSILPMSTGNNDIWTIGRVVAYLWRDMLPMKIDVPADTCDLKPVLPFVILKAITILNLFINKCHNRVKIFGLALCRKKTRFLLQLYAKEENILSKCLANNFGTDF